jgi:hypothetical protein
MRGHKDLQASAAAAAAGTTGTAAAAGHTAAANAGLSDNVLGWIALQGRVDGLSLVDLNYPQHFKGLNLVQVSTVQSRAEGREIISYSHCINAT